MNAINISRRNKKKGRFVSGLLIQHGITQADLVEKSGLSQSFLSNIINNRRTGAKAKGKLARQVIAESLGMTVEELWPKRAA
ncbi:MAG: helix-turn-helix domain-containing protein [Desulfuromonadaceae bacterium]